MAQRFVTELPRPSEQVDSPLGKARTSLINLVTKTATESSHDLNTLLAAITSHFDTTVAEAVQSRETDYVNTMTRIFQKEMDSKKAELTTAMSQARELELQLSELTKLNTELHSKLDRRLQESNLQRKNHYKEILLLRELVTKRKSDSATLRSIDASLVLESSDSAHPLPSSTCHCTNTNERTNDESHLQLESLRHELDARKNVLASTRHERDLLQEKFQEASVQLETFKDQVQELQQNNVTLTNVINRRENHASYSSWWNKGAEGGKESYVELVAGIASNIISWNSASEAMAELLSNEDVWCNVIEGSLTTHHSHEAIDSAWGKLRGRVLQYQKQIIESSAARTQQSRRQKKRRAADTSSSSSHPDIESHLKKTLGRVLELKTELAYKNRDFEDSQKNLVLAENHINILKDEVQALLNRINKGVSTIDCQTDLTGEVVLVESQEATVQKLALAEKRIETLTLSAGCKDELLKEAKAIERARDTTITKLQQVILGHGNEVTELMAMAEERERTLVRINNDLKHQMYEAVTKRREAIENREKVIEKELESRPAVPSPPSSSPVSSSDNDNTDVVVVNDNALIFDKLSSEIIMDQATKDEFMEKLKEARDALDLMVQANKTEVAALQETIIEKDGQVQQLKQAASIADFRHDRTEEYWKIECEKLELEIVEVQSELKSLRSFDKVMEKQKELKPILEFETPNSATDAIRWLKACMRKLSLKSSSISPAWKKNVLNISTMVDYLGVAFPKPVNTVTVGTNTLKEPQQHHHSPKKHHVKHHHHPKSPRQHHKPLVVHHPQHPSGKKKTNEIAPVEQEPLVPAAIAAAHNHDQSSKKQNEVKAPLKEPAVVDTTPVVEPPPLRIEIPASKVLSEPAITEQAQEETEETTVIESVVIVETEGHEEIPLKETEQAAPLSSNEEITSAAATDSSTKFDTVELERPRNDELDISDTNAAAAPPEVVVQDAEFTDFGVDLVKEESVDFNHEESSKLSVKALDQFPIVNEIGSTAETQNNSTDSTNDNMDVANKMTTTSDNTNNLEILHVPQVELASAATNTASYEDTIINQPEALRELPPSSESPLVTPSEERGIILKDHPIIQRMQKLSDAKRKVDAVLLSLRWHSMRTGIAHEIQQARVREFCSVSQSDADQNLPDEWAAMAMRMQCLVDDSFHRHQELKRTCHKVTRQQRAIRIEIVKSAMQLLEYDNAADTASEVTTFIDPRLLPTSVVNFGSLPSSQRVPTRNFPVVDHVMRNSPFKTTAALPIRQTSFATCPETDLPSFRHVTRSSPRNVSSNRNTLLSSDALLTTIRRQPAVVEDRIEQDNLTALPRRPSSKDTVTASSSSASPRAKAAVKKEKISGISGSNFHSLMF